MPFRSAVPSAACVRIAAPADVSGPDPLPPDQMERIRRIKLLQQRRIMQEAFEHKRELAEQERERHGAVPDAVKRPASAKATMSATGAAKSGQAKKPAAQPSRHSTTKSTATPARDAKERGHDAEEREREALERPGGEHVMTPELRREAGLPKSGLHSRPNPPGERTEAYRDAVMRRNVRTSAKRTTSFATNVHVNNVGLDDPLSADAQSEESMVAWQNYVLCAWNDSQGQRLNKSLIGYGYSTDGGQSFIDAGEPPEPPIVGGTWTSDPVTCVNEKTGEFYFTALLDPLNMSGSLRGIGIVRATFSGNSMTWGTAGFVRQIDTSTGLLDKPWIAADSVSGNIYVTYTRYSNTADSIMFQRSTNKGVTWSLPSTISSDAAAGWVQGSRPCVGPDGEVYVVWKEIGFAPLPPTDPNYGKDFFKIRKSTNRGASFGPEAIAVTLSDNFGTGAPGFNREQGITFPSIAIDRSNGPNRGRVYLTWNEAVNYWDSIPQPGVTVNEAEPNDTTATPTPFTPGQTIVGAFNNEVDLDYFSFSATQGTTYVFWCDQVTSLYTMRIFCSDGVSRLSFSGDRFNLPPDQGFIVWTCPNTGTYYLRMAIVTSPPGTYPYRIMTSVDTPGGPGQRARDHRDVFVGSSPNGIDWSAAPVLVNDDLPHFDNWLPEIAVTGGGQLYVAWYDWRDSPVSTCGAVSQTYVSRSDDGGATWAALGPVTDGATAWTTVNSDIIPNQGDYISMFANTVGIYPSWADGRIGTPDVFAAPFLVNGLQVSIVSVVADTGHVQLTWQATGVSPPVDATVYRRVSVGPYQPVATVSSDASNRIVYDDTNVTPGTQYGYRLGILVNGTEVTLGERSVLVPVPPPPNLELALANPNTASLTVRVTLPTAERAWLSLFDLTGRRLREWDISSHGVGTTAIEFGAGLNLKAGFYVIRLTQGGNEVRQRVSIIN
jgi:hypothetical protein